MSLLHVAYFHPKKSQNTLLLLCHHSRCSFKHSTINWKWSENQSHRWRLVVLMLKKINCKNWSTEEGGKVFFVTDEEDLCSCFCCFQQHNNPPASSLIWLFLCQHESDKELFAWSITNEQNYCWHYNIL